MNTTNTARAVFCHRNTMKGQMMLVNEKVIRHKAICDELNKLYERKNHDYGDSFHQIFVEEGMAMLRIRLGDKFNRFKVLSSGQPQQVADESIRDTLMDLANYAIMTIMELQASREVPEEWFAVTNQSPA